ncbi:RNA-binding KH domain-containing protein RCF3-like [Phoenix dactylifera]|uniref:RNA-binding KH domain-containing protein RCF3-like n=1 Tax=Phoenix dactylifera TaxID=42345 RepID=A0A8B7BQD6_PHODC|nr:RNA-binding KH domain-containing protein RCF3-like [Phoenix dactylifera]XP_008783182.2 RNA-binding KH domain-containing protein RCF3-like [Phoenix dactylifera]XP_026658557.2 RNA-binding KH domain-containing protein RCF3-like [Phoenix dactylifera]XP_026658558.2 RNA-binding KH domain-containing protein RCF3-like [Phoenix dactylifera]XP_026658561.2 RNA-binding KH domain-containing protein RCF3-like [Phoenix dactylifera]
MAFPFTPSKRPFERSLIEPNGRGKLQKITSSITQQNQLKVVSGAIIFRMLCPASKSGSVIGKGGSIIARIRQETGAKIRLEEIVPGCDERVVVITGSEKDAEVGKEQGKEGDEDAEAADGGDDTKEGAANDERKEEIDAIEDVKLEKTSPALKALLLVFERTIEGEVESDGGDESSNKYSSVTVRLLVLSSQVGCLLGKGGSVIKQMSAESGAQIRILPRDKLPLCASPNDEIVQITGAVDSVRKALQSVSQQLLENPPRDRDSFPATVPSGPSSHSFSSIPQPEGLPPASYHRPIQGPSFSSRPYDIADYHSSIAPPFSKFHGGAAVAGQPPVSLELLTYRLMCSNDKVGSVIGKGGSIIKTLQHETGCEIKILETEPESDDRIIVISGPALPNDRISPVQDAVLRVQHRIVMAVPDNKENALLSRLLVASNQTGCLLGKGGAIIAEMRKLSGAHIRILGKDQIPKGVPENDEVVQINGEFGAVQEALLQITTRLKHHIFRDKLPPGGYPTFVEQIPPFGPYMGRRESSPPRLFSNLPSFPKDSVGRPYDERSAFPPAFYGSGLPPSLERGAPWGPQGMRESGGPIPMPDYRGGAPQRRIGGFAGGSQPAVITNTTVDVVVPRSLVPSIYGEDGGCLRRIREISDAKITITEPRPEAKETVIIISGMPEQTHAAQSLLQAFVLSESGAP